MFLFIIFFVFVIVMFILHTRMETTEKKNRDELIRVRDMIFHSDDEEMEITMDEIFFHRKK